MSDVTRTPLPSEADRVLVTRGVLVTVLGEIADLVEATTRAQLAAHERLVEALAASAAAEKRPRHRRKASAAVDAERDALRRLRGQGAAAGAILRELIAGYNKLPRFVPPGDSPDG